MAEKATRKRKRAGSKSTAATTAPKFSALALQRQAEVKRQFASYLEQLQSELPTKQKTVPDGLKTAFLATAIICTEECGTAVCVSAHGTLLTCAHCVEEGIGAERELLFTNGKLVRATCVAIDQKMDVALLALDADYSGSASSAGDSKDSKGAAAAFPFVKLAAAPPAVGTTVFCVGQ